jgi:ribosomal protein S20
MTVSSVSSTLSTYQTDVQSPRNQSVQAFKALQSALQSGDLSGAQTAFAALQKDLQPPSQTTQASSATGQSTQMSQGGQDLETLANALSSGELSGAQQAFASLQQDLQGTGRARRHHHHGGSANSTTRASQAGSSSEQDSQISQGSKDLADLQSALTSGDVAGAQKAFASLQQDLQNTAKAGQDHLQQSTTDNSTTQGAGATTTTSPNSHISQGLKDFQTLQTALSTGDLAGAQQAFASLQQDLQNMGRARHHHHHHGAGSVSSTTQPASDSTQAVNSTTSSAGATATVGSALDVQA